VAGGPIADGMGRDNAVMHRVRAAIGSLVFLVVVPGVVAALLPWALTGWQTGSPTLAL
jgi:hypothetical protein